MSITMIAVTDTNNGIGNKRGNLLYKLPKDMAHFRATTEGHTVVMGRKTFESLKNRALPNRDNYVLTKDEGFKADGVTVIHSIADIMKLSEDKEVFIIGGGEVYKQMMPFADKLILTHVHNESKQATTFFPEYDARTWKIKNVKEHKQDKSHKHSFTIATYEKNPLLK